jgi:hypothetical protein
VNGRLELAAGFLQHRAFAGAVRNHHQAPLLCPYSLNG